MYIKSKEEYESVNIYNKSNLWNAIAYYRNEKIIDILCENEEEYNYLKSIGIRFYKDQYVPIAEELKSRYRIK